MLDGCTPWPPDFAERYRREGYWEDRSLSEMLESSIARHPDKTAIVCGSERLSYRELGRRSDSLAVHLLRAGLEPRQRVVLQLPNGATFMPVLFALLRVGVIPVLALRAHRQTEIGHFIRHSDAVAYIVPDTIGDFDYRVMAEEMRRECPSLARVLVNGAPLPGQTDLRPLLAEPVPEAECRRALDRLRPDPADVALMLLSGGTTGIPKLIPRTHNDYVCNAKQSGTAAGFGPDSVFLALLPLAHNYTLASPGILATLAFGGTAVIAPDTRPETVFGLIARERVSIVCAAVPLIATWLNSDWPERTDLSSLRVVGNGGARLQPELRRRLRERFRCQYLESYGTGEGLLNQTRLDDPDELVLESSGRPVCAADEIKVVDDQDRELPDGEAGELLTRGPYTVRGYYRAPAANAAAFTADGFYRMGDVVRKRGRTVYTEGRKKDLINRGGEKISTDEVENLVLRHPKVQNVCIVAMPDATYGERACAFVILKPGESLTLPELSRFLLEQRIAKFKLPERLELVDSFPLSPAGKILRRSLRDAITAKLAAERTVPAA